MNFYKTTYFLIKKISFLSIGIGSCLVPHLATSTELMAEKEFSIGLGGGFNKYHNFSAGLIRPKEVNLGGSVYFNYRTYPWLSWQFSFDDMKSIDILDGHSIDTIGLGSQAILTNRIDNVNFDIGVGAEYTLSFARKRTYDVSPKISLGLQLPVTEKLSVKLNYDFINNVNVSESLKSDIHRYTLNAVYKFANSHSSYPSYDKSLVFRPQTDIIEVNEIKSATEEYKLDSTVHEIYFKTGKSDLTYEHINQLDSIIEQIGILNKEGGISYITIIGTADYRGPKYFNDELASKRAINTYNYLTDSQGWLKDKIDWSYKVISEDETHCSSNSDLCLQPDRSSVIKIILNK